MGVGVSKVKGMSDKSNKIINANTNISNNNNVNNNGYGYDNEKGLYL